MKHGKILAGLAILALAAGTVLADGDRKEIRGDYVEARTCAVWIGSCFANGEVNLTGKNAVVGWSVKEGAWDGVALDGLKIVAVLNAEGTLHTKYEGKVFAVAYVDKKATDRQAEALVAMAKALAPDHLADIRKISRKGIDFSRKGIEATLTVEKEVQVRTAAICECENSSCHAYLFYPAFSKAAEVESAKLLAHSYQGDTLGVRWSDPERQSAMVGSFAR
ncbi:MAG: DUF1326 domain-containing protein [Planctomycetes bacterium]|nr:DUF1326 domain-containing protein [Planctomycetota bacterium]